MNLHILSRNISVERQAMKCIPSQQNEYLADKANEIFRHILTSLLDLCQ